MPDLSPAQFFQWTTCSFPELFEGVEQVWDVVKIRLNAYLKEKMITGSRGVIMQGAVIEGDVQIGEGTVVEPGVYIKGPTIIGRNCEIRHGAYIRGQVLVGDHCVVGHTTEVKHAVFMDGAKAGHFAYIGDSILGCKVNLGAGTKLANLKIIDGSISLRVGGGTIDTGMRKLGAILGDNTETGCNSVTSPGTLLGMNCLVYPCHHARGVHPAGSILRPKSA